MTDLSSGLSFRDPSGRIFQKNGAFYRSVDSSYRAHWEKLESSGLLSELTGAGLLIAHEEMKVTHDFFAGAWKVIRPAQVPFISYSYEWCFGQLREAALLALEIQKRALSKGMVLKDAASANIQFVDGRAVWIDTLSFEIYEEGKPWAAYQQFCRHFLAPLLLGARDPQALRTLMSFTDGLPLDLASNLLPWHSWMNFGTLCHIHGNAKARETGAGLEKRYGIKNTRLSLSGLNRIVESLNDTIKNIRLKKKTSHWTVYRPEEHYGSEGFENKKKIVSEFLGRLRPRIVFDFGSNTGFFSKIASEYTPRLIALESDHAAAEIHYKSLKQAGEKKVLPLVMDICQPVPGRGWENKERLSFLERAEEGGTVMALGLVHHLAIGEGIPLEKVAGFFSKFGRYLIVEFIPENDPKAREVGMRKENAFKNYSKEIFEAAFKSEFKILEAKKPEGNLRGLYLMESISNGK